MLFTCKHFELMDAIDMAYSNSAIPACIKTCSELGSGNTDSASTQGLKYKSSTPSSPGGKVVQE